MGILENLEYATNIYEKHGMEIWQYGTNIIQDLQENVKGEFGKELEQLKDLFLFSVEGT